MRHINSSRLHKLLSDSLITQNAKPLGYMLFDVVGPADEKGVIPVAGYLVYRIAANRARV
jgi:hypothetical protein